MIRGRGGGNSKAKNERVAPLAAPLILSHKKASQHYDKTKNSIHFGKK